LLRTLEFAKPWLEGGAVGLFPRGRSAIEELEQEPPSPVYAMETLASVIDVDAAILRVRVTAKPDLDGSGGPRLRVANVARNGA
jgi:hypothetical protein